MTFHCPEKHRWTWTACLEKGPKYYMRDQINNQNMTQVVIWSGPEAPKAVLCRCCGDPAAHRAFCFIRKNLPTMTVTFATPARLWLSSDLTHRESCCLPCSFLNPGQGSGVSKGWTGKAKGSFNKRDYSGASAVLKEKFHNSLSGDSSRLAKSKWSSLSSWDILCAPSSTPGWHQGRICAEVDLMILIGPFQLTLLSDSVISSQFCTTVALNVKGRSLQHE